MTYTSKRSAFIVTKPLQYINATNIPDDNLRDCLIIDLFSEAEGFFNKISGGTDYWHKTLLFRDINEAFIFLIKNKKVYERLYLDSDQGIITLYYLYRLRNLKVFTYEEGFGSYRRLRDKRDLLESLKIYFYRQINCGNWFGSSIYSQGIYLYHPKVFQKLIPENKKKLFRFRVSFLERLTQLKELDYFYESIDFNKYKDKDIIIYLSPWNINMKVFPILDRYPGFMKILKPHPHIKGDINDLNEFDEIVSHAIPAEFFLLLISKYCNNLTIIHENSTSLIYLDNIEYKEINIAREDSKKVYNTIKAGIKDNPIN